MSQADVTVPANLVPYLRDGAKLELIAVLDVLIEVLNGTDLRAYRASFAALDEARGLIDAVGFLDNARQPDVELDLDRWPRLVLKVLQHQYRAEVERMQDATSLHLNAPMREIPALRGLITEVCERSGAPRNRESRPS